MEQRNPKLIKKPTYVFAHKDCINCIKKNECIRASMLGSPPRKAFLNLLGYREKTNKFMLEGTNKHKEFFKDLKELDDYGLNNFFKDLYSGKEINLTEFQLCSCKHGLRGHLDAIKIKYDNGTYNFEITELKPVYRKNYNFQLIAYCLILSDPLCRIIYKKKNSLISRRLYPNNNIVVNIKAKFIYYKYGKENQKDWVEWNQLKPFMNCVSSRAKKIRMFMRAGIFYLEKMPECDFCSRVNCDFKDICSRYGYKKERQYYLGKRQILIKSKPKIL